MIFDVYELGEVGPGDAGIGALNAGAQRGELKIRRRFPASPHDKTLMATLCAPGTRDELLHALLYVNVVAMNSVSMVLEGTAVISERHTQKSKVNHFKVRWLCKLPGAPAILNTEKLAARAQKRRADIARDPFHPANDDIDSHPPNDATYGPLDPSIST